MDCALHTEVMLEGSSQCDAAANTEYIRAGAIDNMSCEE